jgi:hypothetical protein
MNPDVGVFIGLIVVSCGAGMLGMSYFGAYMLGRARGRREVELEQRVEAQGGERLMDHDRVLMVEGAVASMAQAIERLSDVQRVALLERMKPAPDQRSIARPRQHDTPA